MILFGDLFQLPPVVDDPEILKFLNTNFGGIHFFFSEEWKNGDFEIYELSRVFRQADDQLIDILNMIRMGTVDEDILKLLNSLVKYPDEKEPTLFLTTTRSRASHINETRLNKLPGKRFRYEACVIGEFPEERYPTDQVLELKEGAQVIFLRNHPDKLWVNGTLGQIKSLSEDEVIVYVNGVPFSVLRETWQNIRYQFDDITKTITSEVIGNFTQFLLALAWAMTIHKSQGLTLESVHLDFEDDPFAPGQT